MRDVELEQVSRRVCDDKPGVLKAVGRVDERETVSAVVGRSVTHRDVRQGLCGSRNGRAGDAVRSGTDYRSCVAVQASPYAISSRKHPGFTGGISRALSRHLLDAEAGADGCIRRPCRAPGDPAGTVGMPRDGEEKTRRETTSASAQAAQSRFSIAARRAFPWQFERDRHS